MTEEQFQKFMQVNGIDSADEAVQKMLAQLQQIIRKRIRFPPEKALFLFINNKMYPVTAIIGSLYDSNKDKDGFLYVTYCQESTFGATSS